MLVTAMYRVAIWRIVQFYEPVTLFMSCVFSRSIAVSSAVAGGSSSVLVVIPGTVQSTALVATSHLAAGVLRKQQDSIGLTPTLANYVNNRLIDHITGWQTDAVERQVCIFTQPRFVGMLCVQLGKEITHPSRI
jgi:hypothetical protein